MAARAEYGVPAAGQGYLRASTADRERALDVLKAGFAEGRLSPDEHDARAGRALRARTLGDLALITADLPGGHPAVAGPAPSWPAVSGPARSWPATARTNSLAVAALLCGIGQLFFGPLATVPAIVLGHLGRREIRRTGEGGNGAATVGLVLGWAGAGLIILTALCALLVVVAVRH